MAKGIVRHRDQDAIFRVAAEDEWEQQLMPQPAPPSEASEPPQGAEQKPAPNSNKFKTPANGLKKVLDQHTAPDDPGIPTEPHQSFQLKEWADNKPGFTKTYFKPEYQDALKTHLGEGNYNKLLHHMPEEHHKALTEHEQATAPKSNKFTTPANGLKKLLETPNTHTNHVIKWLQDHPGFQKTYMSPKYEDALKGHLGEKNYTELKQHLKQQDKVDGIKDSLEKSFAPAGMKVKDFDTFMNDHGGQDPGGQNSLSASPPKKPTKKWVGEGPEPGTEQALQPPANALKPGQEGMLATWMKEHPEWKPPANKDDDDYELEPADLGYGDEAYDQDTYSSDALHQDLKKIFPNASSFGIGALQHDQDADKKLLQHLTKGWQGSKGPELQALYDKHFGDDDEIDQIKQQQQGLAPEDDPWHTEPKKSFGEQLNAVVPGMHPGNWNAYHQKDTQGAATALQKAIDTHNHSPEQNAALQKIYDDHFGDQSQGEQGPKKVNGKTFGQAVVDMFAGEKIKNSPEDLDAKTPEQQQQMVENTLGAKPEYNDKLHQLHQQFFGGDAWDKNKAKADLIQHLKDSQGSNDYHGIWANSLSNQELKELQNSPNAVADHFNDYMHDLEEEEPEDEDYFNPDSAKDDITSHLENNHGYHHAHEDWLNSLDDDDLEYYQNNPSAASNAFNEYHVDNYPEDFEDEDENDDYELEDDDNYGQSSGDLGQVHGDLPHGFLEDWKKAFPAHTYIDQSTSAADVKKELEDTINESEEEGLGDPAAYGDGEYRTYYDKWMEEKVKAQQLYDKYFDDDNDSQPTQGSSQSGGQQQGIGDKLHEALGGKMAPGAKEKWNDWEHSDPDKMKGILENMLQPHNWGNSEQAPVLQKIYDEHFGNNSEDSGDQNTAMQIAKGIQSLDPKTFGDDWVNDWAKIHADDPGMQKKTLQELIKGGWSNEETEGYQALLDKHFGEGEGGKKPLSEYIKKYFPDLDQKDAEAWNTYDAEGIKDHIKMLNSGSGGSTAEKFQKIYDEAFGGEQETEKHIDQNSEFPHLTENGEDYSDGYKKYVDDNFGQKPEDLFPQYGAGFSKEVQDKYKQSLEQQGDAQSPDQQQSVAQGMQSIFPNAKVDFGQMSQPELKHELESFIEHLSETPGHADNVAKLKALYDQNFGDGDIEAIKNQMGKTPTQTLGEALHGKKGGNWGTFQGATWDTWSPEVQQEKLQEHITKAKDHDSAHAAELQKIYDQYFGDGDLEAIKSQMPSQGPNLGAMSEEIASLGGSLAPLAHQIQNSSPSVAKTLLQQMIDQTKGTSVGQYLQDIYDDHFGQQPSSEQYTGAEPLTAEELTKGVDWGDQKEIPQSHADHAQILDAFGEPSEDFMQWFSKTNDYPWGEKPADDKALLSMLANPENPWTKGKVQEYLKDQEGLEEDFDNLNNFYDHMKNGVEPWDGHKNEWVNSIIEQHGSNAMDYVKSQYPSAYKKWQADQGDQNEINQIKQHMPQGDKPDPLSVISEHVFGGIMGGSTKDIWKNKSPEQMKNDIENLANGLTSTGQPYEHEQPQVQAKWKKVHDELYGGDDQQSDQPAPKLKKNGVPTIAQLKAWGLSPEDAKTVSGMALGNFKNYLEDAKNFPGDSPHKWDKVVKGMGGGQQQSAPAKKKITQNLVEQMLKDAPNSEYGEDTPEGYLDSEDLTSPEEIKNYLENLVKDNPTYHHEAKWVLDQLWGDGANQSQKITPDNFDAQQFANELGDIHGIPGEDINADDGTKIKNMSVDEAKAELEDYLSNPGLFGSDHQKHKQLYDKYFGGNEQKITPENFDAQQYAKEFADIHNMDPDTIVLTQAGGSSKIKDADYENVKKDLKFNMEYEGWSNPEVKEKHQKLWDKYFGGGESQPAEPQVSNFDPDNDIPQLLQDYADIFNSKPENTSLADADLSTPEKAKKALETAAKAWAHDDEGDKIKELIDAYFGSGGQPSSDQQGGPLSSQSYDGKSLFADLDKIVPGLFDNDVWENASPEKAAEYLDTWIGDGPNSGAGIGPQQIQQMKQLKQKYFGDNDEGPPEWNASTFAEQYKEILPGSSSSLASGSASVEKAKSKLEELISNNPGTEKTKKLEELHKQWFGKGMPTTSAGSSSSSSTYTPPVSGSQHYKDLMKAVTKKNNAGAFSHADMDKFKSQEFKDWWDNAPTAYKETHKNNPGIAIDDFDAGSYGAPTQGGSWEDQKIEKKNFDPYHKGLGKGKEKVDLKKQWPDAQGYGKLYPPWSENPYPTSSGHGRPQEFNPEIDVDPDNPNQLEIPLPAGNKWDAHGAQPLYRAFTIHLKGPKAPDKGTKAYDIVQKIRKILEGSEEGETDTPTLENYAKDDTDRQWGGDGVPSKAVPGTYNHPDLAPLVLEYAQLGAKDGGKASPGMGIHWTTNQAKGYDVPGSVSLNSHERADDSKLPVTMSALWSGAGEDPDRSGGASGYPNEEEITLVPGAPVQVQRLEVRHKDHQKFVDIMKHDGKGLTPELVRRYFPHATMSEVKDWIGTHPDKKKHLNSQIQLLKKNKMHDKAEKLKQVYNEAFGNGDEFLKPHMRSAALIPLTDKREQVKDLYGDLSGTLWGWKEVAKEHGLGKPNDRRKTPMEVEASIIRIMQLEESM